MLLNEFLKQRRKVEQEERKIPQQQDCKLQEHEATIAQLRKELQAAVAPQQKQIEALTAGLQKVGAQFEAGKAAPQIVDNSQ